MPTPVRAGSSGKKSATPSRPSQPKVDTPQSTKKAETPIKAVAEVASPISKLTTTPSSGKAETTPVASPPSGSRRPRHSHSEKRQREDSPVVADAESKTTDTAAAVATTSSSNAVNKDHAEKRPSDVTTRMEARAARLAFGDLEICRSKAVSAHAIGISTSAMNASQTRLVVAKEDSSLCLYQIIPSGNRHNLSLLPLRNAGGAPSLTITKVVFAMQDRVLLVAYLSGQIAVLDAATLTPMGISERIGGSVWDLCVVNEDGSNMVADVNTAGLIHEQTVFCAVADGSWLQLELTESRVARSTAQDRQGRVAAQDGGKAPAKHNAYGYSYSIQLLQSVPRVLGANRALAVTPFYNHTKPILESSEASSPNGSRRALNHTTAIIGADDMGNVIAWEYRGFGVRHACTHLWTCQLPKGAYAKSIACDAATSTIAVGTSLGDVVMIRGGEGPAAGTVISSFSHHKGPISSVISVGGSDVSSSAFYATGWHELLRSYRFNAEEGAWQPAGAKRRTHYHEATSLQYHNTAQAIISMARDGTVMVCEAIKGGIASRAPRYINTNAGKPYALGRKIGVTATNPKPASFVLFTAAEKGVEVYKSNEGMNHWEALARLATVSQKREDCYIQGLWCDERAQYLVYSNKFKTSVVAVTHRIGSGVGGAAIKMVKVADFDTINVADVVFLEPTDTANGNHSEVEGSSITYQRPQRLECFVLHHGTVTHISLGGVANAIVTHIPTPHAGTGVHYDSMAVVRKIDSISFVRNVAANTEERPAAGCRDAALVLASSDAEAGGVLVAKYVRPDGSLASCVSTCATALPHGWSTVSTHRADKLEGCIGGQSAPVGIARMRGQFIDLFRTPKQDLSLPSTIPAETVFFARIERELQVEEPVTKGARVEGAVARKGPIATVWIGYCGRGLLMAVNGSWWLADEAFRLVTRQREALLAAQKSAETSTNVLQQLMSQGELLSQSAVTKASSSLGPRTTFVAGFQVDNAGIMLLERDIEGEVDSLPLMWKVRRFGN